MMMMMMMRSYSPPPPHIGRGGEYDRIIIIIIIIGCTTGRQGLGGRVGATAGGRGSWRGSECRGRLSGEQYSGAHAASRVVTAHSSVSEAHGRDKTAACAPRLTSE